MAKAFIDDTNLTDIADAIRATLDESRQYLPSEMAAAIQSIPIMAQLNRKKYFCQVPSQAASGYATIEQIEGNTVAFNQLLDSSRIEGTSSFLRNGVTWTVNSDGSVTANGLASALSQFNIYADNANTGYKGTVGHKYYTFLVAGGNTNTYYGRMISNDTGFDNSVGERKIVTCTASDRAAGLVLRIASGYNAQNKTFYPTLIDLTTIFGAGNEPTTVADFEAWMAQNIGTLPYYDYNAGELLSVKMSGMQTEDSSQQTLDTLPFDVTTFTGINPNTNTREVMFASGMKQADQDGTVKDTLDLRSDTATVNVGSRAYQSGDESNPDVLTDGTTTYYALTTPIEYTDLQDANGNPLNPRYKVEQGGTETVLPVNTSSPTTVAPTLSTIYKKNI